MFTATRRGLRSLWMAGAALLAIVVVKLFVNDLGSTGTVARIVSFIGVAVSIGFTTRARALVEDLSAVDYPLLDRTKSLAVEVQLPEAHKGPGLPTLRSQFATLDEAFQKLDLPEENAMQ